MKFKRVALFGSLFIGIFTTVISGCTGLNGGANAGSSTNSVNSNSNNLPNTLPAPAPTATPAPTPIPTPVPTPTPTPTPLSYVGCYTDDSSRALPIQLSNVGTIESCVALAQAGGFAYAGLQDGGQCFGGNVPGYTLEDDSNCNMPCSSNADEMCGGNWVNSVYATGIVNYQSMMADTFTIEPDACGGSNVAMAGGGVALYCTGGIQSTVNFPASSSGLYQISIIAYGDLVTGYYPNAEFTLDGVDLGGIQIDTTTWTTYSMSNIASTPGAHTLTVTFTNDYYAGAGQDSNLYIQTVVVAPMSQ